MPEPPVSAITNARSGLARTNTKVRDAAVARGGFVGKMFESGRWTTGELASWPISAALNLYMSGGEFQSGNRTRRNSMSERLGGVGIDLAQNVAFSMLGGGLMVGLGVGAVMIGGTLGYQAVKRASLERRVARRNFHRPDLSPMYTQRAMKSQQQNFSRIMDTQRFIGNEASHFARRGV